MDWKLFAQLMVTFAIAIAGGWLGHYLSARRDLANERRKLQISYLLEAYRRMEGAAQRTENHERYFPDLESAVADIQLLGSPHQVSMARKFANDMAQNSTAASDTLLFDLRQSLRSELQLSAVSERIPFLRFFDKESDPDGHAG
jgi:hypothetical protein